MNKLELIRYAIAVVATALLFYMWFTGNEFISPIFLGIIVIPLLLFTKKSA